MNTTTIDGGRQDTTCPFFKEALMDIYERFRHNLQLLLVERGITPAELSKALGWHEKRLSNLMDLRNLAEPKIHEIESLCHWFKIEISDFFHKTGYVVFK